MPSIKRKATSPVRPSPSKKRNLHGANDDSRFDFDHSSVAEKHGIIDRRYYPPEISNEQCERYNNNEIPRPIEVLRTTIKETQDARKKIPIGKSVVHYYKRDLRTSDNRALSMASKKAMEGGVPLICIFIVSPQDYEAHGTSAARVDFELRTLDVLQKDLNSVNVPLYMTTIDNRKDIPKHILSKCQEWGAKHIFCNMEYEVDELRREAKLTKMCLDAGIDFTVVHDDVIVPPGALTTGAGKQFSVYSPWFRAWLKHLHEHPHLLNEADPISSNPANTKDLFPALLNLPVPHTPPPFSLSEIDRKRLANYWPAGEHEAHARLTRFLSSKISKYKETRNFPSHNSTSSLSVHFSSGTLAARTAVRAARDNNSVRKLDCGNPGISGWISELAWRDFYKHVLCHWPYVCMGKPFKYEYSEIEWSYDESHFRAWCEGKTGYPIVDAAMRQLNDMGYMHNRCRMIVGSFLAKDLLIDWRMGEKYFMNKLIDGDWASNNGGWGFSASTGVDPQPYFRIFNPALQSEKFDEGGEYIRKWVPELRGIEGKAIHDPYGRGMGAKAEKAGYPKPVVDHKEARNKALERYKAGLGRSTANVGGGVHN